MPMPHYQASTSTLDSLWAQLMLIVDSPTDHLVAIFVIGVTTLVLAKFLQRPLEATALLLKQFGAQEKKQQISVDESIDGYNKLHDDSVSTLEERNAMYAKLVNAYYDLATNFYEWGWGQCFHFADKKAGESFHDSILRHEHYLASKLRVKKGDKVLDTGCGIGGPMRNITRFTQCDITGITINKYQVMRGNELTKQAGLADQCRSIQGDFMHLPFEDNSFDAVYAIEATCHAPDRNGVYGEILRVLKPGGMFATYEWCLTDKHDPKNADHLRYKKQIEEGDGLPDLATTHHVEGVLANVGFDVIEARDVATDENPKGEPWYLPLTPNWNPLSQRFQFNAVGMPFTRYMLKVLEFIKLAPAGTSKVQGMLQEAAIGCANGGIFGTFTPMHLMVAQKPLTASRRK